ncbi:MAG: GGDEF domain-containing protein [Treponema sp.]|nr:GGDEF domain-containing protein [Treponema sp.]
MLALTADFLISCNFTDKNNTSIYVKFIWPFISALLLFIYLFLIIKESRIDSLTGLDNRYSFFELTGRISRSRSGESWVFAMIDINNFRSINEVYGNFEGDNALRNFAKIIKKCGAKTDFAARYGGDEFILVSKAENGLDIFINKINQELFLYNEKNEKPYNIEISFGLDTFVADGSKTIDDFLSSIDKYMHKHNDESRRAGDSKA